MVTIQSHWVQRILHTLRDVEIAVNATQKHDPNIGIHEVAERLAVLRLVITQAIESAK